MCDHMLAFKCTHAPPRTCSEIIDDTALLHVSSQLKNRGIPMREKILNFRDI